ncbi:unnamed protein product [Prorocentrum cordatum]|uniref:SSD domain-containing protein n=1 Tax=Prorocentrum cordatum TaxID=2364126 RepID=A0ABN9UB80_9DINO|nr:unnamed protein product [Polarella glacialis]
MAGDGAAGAPQELPAPGAPQARARAPSPGRAALAACAAGALLVPAACAALAVGLKDAEPELSVSSIWAPDQGGYYEDKQYASAVFDDPRVAKWTGGFVTGFFTSYPKSGGTHMTKASLMELIDRQKAVENATVEYNGNTFTYQDVCYGQLQEGVYLGYTLPCRKITAVHAYREGGYEMDVIPRANEMWYSDLLVPYEVKPLINYFFLSLDFPPYLNSDTAPQFGLPADSVCIPAGLPCDLATSQAVSYKAYCCLVECADVCAASRAQAVSAIDPTVFQSDAACMTCMTHGQRSLYEGLEDAIVTSTLVTAGMPYAGSTTSDKDEWMYGLALGGVKGQLAVLGVSFPTDDDYIAWMLGNFGVSKQAADNMFTADASYLGLVKGARSIEASTSTGTDLHVWASGDIYGWSEGAYPRQLMMGKTIPDILEYDTANPLTSVLALKTTYFFEVADTFRAKVASPYRAQGPSGHAPVNISVDDALEVVGRFKKRMEEAWNFDRGSDDLNKYHSFTEAYRGTFWRGLKRFTEGSVVPSALSYLAVIVVSVVLMSSCQLTESKMVVSMIGTIFSVAAFSGALGIIVMGGSTVMISSAWTLPFLLVGLGVDDMYVILTTLTKEGGNTAGGYFSAMAQCLVPITMTSLTNAGMFAMLLFIEVPAVREVGKIAVLAICLQYLAMVTAFPCVCYFDMLRTESRRLDCICCLKGRRGTTTRTACTTCSSSPSLGPSWGVPLS